MTALPSREQTLHRRWQRIDQPGLELAHIAIEPRGIAVTSTLIDAGEDPVSLRYLWLLDPAWRTRSLRIDHLTGAERQLTIERTGDTSWRIDKATARHLDGCAELDLSATPFCNALAMRYLGGDGALTAAYIAANDLSVVPSRQRYERISDTHWRYHDLGVAAGFTANLRLDAQGLVYDYEGLFKAIEATA